MLEPGELDRIARQRRAFGRVQSHPQEPALRHADIKPQHLLHDPSSGALTGLLDWGDVSLGHSESDLAIIGAFCGPLTLQGLLDRLADADAERAAASIPFLLTVRRLQDAHYEQLAHPDRVTKRGSPRRTVPGSSPTQEPP
jgi:aminoglycoside phosphotransferase (APT) family kinase protein